MSGSCRKTWITGWGKEHCHTRPRRLSPTDDGWWRHVAKLLQHQIWLSDPKPIDCRDPDAEIEPLYEAIVSANRPLRAQRIRVASEIRGCLNGLNRQFKAKEKLPGFGGRDVEVLKAHRGRHGTVVIEGVNLATKNAEMQSDAAASRLERLLQGQGEAECKVLLGYLPSPDGLNGEAVLLDWIRQRTGAEVFDLRQQRDQLHDAAAASLARVDAR